jgi:hypothetical protein
LTLRSIEFTEAVHRDLLADLIDELEEGHSVGIEPDSDDVETPRTTRPSDAVKLSADDA